MTCTPQARYRLVLRGCNEVQEADGGARANRELRKASGAAPSMAESGTRTETVRGATAFTASTLEPARLAPAMQYSQTLSGV